VTQTGKPIRKRYVYKCKCGKRPMRGSVSLKPGTDFQFQQIFDILDMAWAQDHNQPGCTLGSKTVTIVERS
jgi:hypothetical protein